MKTESKLLLGGVLLIVGAAVAAAPAVAKSMRMPVDFWEVSCETEPGRTWISDDGVLHNRGRVSQAVFYAYDESLGAGVLVGEDTVVSNANLDPATFSGRVFGTFTLTYLPASELGTFDGKFTGSLTGGVSFIGRAVGHGTGPLRGKKMKLSFATPELPLWLLEVLEENPPACGQSVGIYHDTGYILAPGGR